MMGTTTRAVDRHSHHGTTTFDDNTTSLSPSSSSPNSPSSNWLEVCVAEEMNPSRRCHMEDCSVIHPPGTWNAADPDLAYLGVYDGHGGRDVAVFLKHTLARIVATELSFPDQADMATRLSRAFLMADVYARCQLVETRAGATVAICLIQKLAPHRFQIVTANAGDARIVVCDNQGKAIRMTRDHRPDDDDEVDRIRQAGGFCFKGRVLGVLAVTRSLGDFYLKDFVIAEPHVSDPIIMDVQPTLSSSSPSPASPPASSPVFVILACDGLWDVMTDQEAVDLVHSFEGERNHVAKFLVQEALRRGSRDNITAVIAFL